MHTYILFCMLCECYRYIRCLIKFSQFDTSYNSKIQQFSFQIRSIQYYINKRLASETFSTCTQFSAHAVRSLILRIATVELNNN